MTAIASRATPQVGIFWLVQTPDGETRLLTAGCPLDQAEPYSDCHTYGPGHYETWAHWRRDRTVDPALRALVRSHEYEDWPRGRIVFDRARDLFILYADRKLMTPATIARIATHFHLPEGGDGVGEALAEAEEQRALAEREYIRMQERVKTLQAPARHSLWVPHGRQGTVLRAHPSASPPLPRRSFFGR